MLSWWNNCGFCWTCGFMATPSDKGYGVYPYPWGVWCLRVWVRCRSPKPILYPCGTLAVQVKRWRSVGDVDKWVSELMESRGVSFVLSNWAKYLLHHLSCKGHFTPHNSSHDLPITNITKSSHPPLGAKPHNVFYLPKTNSTKSSATH